MWRRVCLTEAEKEIKELVKDINELRKKLDELIEQKEWNLLDSDVISFSQKLNLLIVQYKKMLDQKINTK